MGEDKGEVDVDVDIVAGGIVSTTGMNYELVRLEGRGEVGGVTCGSASFLFKLLFVASLSCCCSITFLSSCIGGEGSNDRDALWLLLLRVYEVLCFGVSWERFSCEIIVPNPRFRLIKSDGLMRFALM